MNARATLVHWVDAGALAAERLPDALRAADVTPSPAQWRHFVVLAFAWLGMALLASAAVCFVAANWQALGRFAKFALLESALVAALVVAVWRGLDMLAGRVALFAAAVLMGVLLALVGQVYQTGADSWELFAAWAAAIAVWVVLGRQPALWLLWLALLNVAVLLYFRTSVARGLGVAEFLFAPRAGWWAVFALDVAALVAWEAAGARWPAWGAQRWAPRVIATVAGILVTTVLATDLLGFGRVQATWGWLPYVLWIGALYWAYRVRTRDLYMLSGMVLSLVVVIAVLIGPRLVGGGMGFGFLGTGLLILGCAAAGSYWLRAVGAEERS
ncbi:MAG: DUF2157 domain-containing protein [Burkholderiales bacterium]